ncbi:MAG: DUF6478 family protein [Roseobacter sp.]
MDKRTGNFLEKLSLRRSLRFWTDAARATQTAPAARLNRQVQYARLLRVQLDRLLDAANHRRRQASTPPTVGNEPHNADWSWRPEAWRDRLAENGIAPVSGGDPFGSEIRVFHDCAASELSLRQVCDPGSSPTGSAPYRLRLDVFAFAGSFLSLALDLPETARQGLRKNHVIRVNADMAQETPLEVFVRLNVVHGANTEVQVRELPQVDQATTVEFDLAYMTFDPRQVSNIWIDVIFESPRMNALTLRDLTMSRFPRAQM